MKPLLTGLVLLISCICVGQTKTITNPATCIGLNGEVLIAWVEDSSLCFSRSANGGISWPPEKKIIAPVKQNQPIAKDAANRHGLPQIACDTGQSQYRGRIYVCWSDEKHGAKNKDVFLVYSDDRGQNWTEPILVTYRPNHKEQFKPIISIYQKSGRVALAYYDKQNYPASEFADVYLALSYNGGLQFQHYKINTKPIKYKSKHTFSLELTTRRDSVEVIWIEKNNRKQSRTVTEKWLKAYDEKYLAGEMAVEKSILYEPTKEITFTLPIKSKVSAFITKPLEPAFEKEIFKNKKCSKGKNMFTLDFVKAGLSKGNYVLTFYYNGRNSFVWIVDDE